MILHFAPGNLSGHEACGGRDSCFASCLYYAGKGMFPAVQAARLRKTRMFFEQREQFMDLLGEDIHKAVSIAVQENLNLVVRLNGTSDIPWESIHYLGYGNVMEAFPFVMFYDYTKLLGRKKLPFNYHLTFSRGSDNEAKVIKAIDAGMNVAAVFDEKPLTYYGLPVVDGDEDDLRFLDPSGVVVALKPKGRARRDETTFVIRLEKA